MGPMHCAMIGGRNLPDRSSIRFRPAAVCFAVGFAACATTGALADEGGTSFWLPGTFGSLAAVPQQQPGWALTTAYYHTDVSASGDVARAREFEIGRIPGNVSATLNATLKATGDLALISPGYAFATPVLGGQAAVGLTGIFANTSTSLAGTLSGTITLPPPVGTIPFMRSDSISDSLASVGDLYPQYSLRWNAGVNNYMTYVMGDVPVGAYDSTRLSNIGLGHGAIDAGGGYTYFNPQAGQELSAVVGLTYNFTNPATNYQSGIDWHLDWGASQFVSKQVSIGAVGYFYDQLSGDSGSGDRIGSFESRVIGIGPQIAFLFPVGQMQGYLNVKGYEEFDAQNRPEGWNAWVVLSISPAAPAPSAPPTRRPMLTK